MNKLHSEIEDMRRRLADNAQSEQALVKALRETLNQVDDNLLSEVRLVTAQHEARRTAILNELQLLAARLCTFPVARVEPVAAIEDDVTREIEHNGHTNGHANGHANGNAHAPGDWRIAARNIADDIEYYLKGQGLNH